MSTAHAPSYVEDGLPKERYQLYHEEKAKGGLALTMFGGSSTRRRRQPVVVRPDRHQPTTAIIPCCQEFADAHPPARLRADDPAHPYRAGGPAGTPATGCRRVGLALARAASTAPSPRRWRTRTSAASSRPTPRRAPRAKEGGLDGLEVSAPRPPARTSSGRPPSTSAPTSTAAASTTASASRSRCSRRSARPVGADYIVGIRMSGDEMLEDGLTPTRACEIAVRPRAIAA